MSLASYRTVLCDRCNEESDAGHSPSEARAIAKRHGWARRRIEGVSVDLCPGCAGQQEPAS